MDLWESHHDLAVDKQRVISEQSKDDDANCEEPHKFQKAECRIDQQAWIATYMNHDWKKDRGDK